jgi:DNA polymerase-1
MGLHTLLLPGYEADDLLATLTDGLRAEGFEVVVVSGDKDLAQLVGEGVQLYDLAKGRHWSEDEVPEKMGVRADQIVDLLALMGDASDNIPGVRGIGQKGAVALLEAFGDLDGVFSRLDEVAGLPVRGAKSLRGKLEEGRELAFLSRDLATVKRDVPLEWSSDELRYEGAETKTLEAFAETWGLGRVAARVPRRS